MALPAGAPLGLPHDLGHGIAGEMGDLAIPDDLLSHKVDELIPVIQGVVHAVPHVDLIAVALDAGAQGRMHPLYRIQVAGSNHNEIAGHGLGSDQRPRASLALAGDGVLPLLQSSEQALLRLRPQGIDLVYE